MSLKSKIADTLKSAPNFEDILLRNDIEDAKKVSQDIDEIAQNATRPAYQTMALHKVAIGELREIPRVSVDPAKCRIWEGNPRAQELINADTCADLIDAMRTDGGQTTPGIVRPLRDDPQYEYEVIAGSRRHFSVSYLRAHGYPDMLYIADVYHVDDAYAFRLTDMENRGRKDLSDYETAVAYNKALQNYFDGSQAKMADMLGINSSWLYRILAMATLPPEIFDAYEKPNDLSITAAYKIAKEIGMQNIRATAIQEAIKIRKERESPFGNKLSHTAITNRILSSLQDDDVKKHKDTDLIEIHHGSKVLITIVRRTKKKMNIQIANGTGATRDELLKHIDTILEASNFFDNN